jgi:uncharacterized protein (DUF427 family)
MTLTLGTAPFGHRPGGAFNFELPDRRRLLYFEDCPRRVRGELGGETVVDSRRAKLLHEHGHLPVYYFPQGDVRPGLLEPSDHTTHCPKKGDATYWSIRVGERLAENAVWTYPEPIEDAPWLEGFVAFYWRALDRWLEEDEEVFVHPRDPYHRVDVLSSSRHVRVSVDGELVAETSRPRLLFETGLPVRYYVPREDTRDEALASSELHTSCPYKGVASYFDVVAGGAKAEALAWYYTEPVAAVGAIAEHVCFFNERADLEVDGERQERPETPWSRPDWAKRPLA